MPSLAAFNAEHPQSSQFIRPAELENIPVTILNAKERPGEGAWDDGRPKQDQVDFELSFYDIDTGELKNATMSLGVTSYRRSFVAHFRGSDEPIGPLYIVRRYMRSGNPTWLFDEQPSSEDTQSTDPDDLPF